jgi:hypothetical protein
MAHGNHDRHCLPAHCLLALFEARRDSAATDLRGAGLSRHIPYRFVRSLSENLPHYLSVSRDVLDARCGAGPD